VNNKQRVFLFGRKHGFTPEQVRTVLAELGAPPTLSEKREQRYIVSLLAGIGEFREFSIRKSNDFREIPRELADLAIAKLADSADLIKSAK